MTGSGIPEAEKVPDSSSIIWQEELNQREAEVVPLWATADVASAPLHPTGWTQWLETMLFIQNNYSGVLFHCCVIYTDDLLR